MGSKTRGSFFSPDWQPPLEAFSALGEYWIAYLCTKRKENGDLLLTRNVTIQHGVPCKHEVDLVSRWVRHDLPYVSIGCPCANYLEASSASYYMRCKARARIFAD